MSIFNELKLALKGTHSRLKKQSPTQAKGNKAEDLALRYLKKHGLKLIKRQFMRKMGEIDLIMQDGNTLVFVEVRSLKNNAYHEPFESISPNKRRKILLTADSFLNKHDWTNDLAVRFDVISISGNQPTPKITWIPDAFGVE